MAEEVICLGENKRKVKGGERGNEWEMKWMDKTTRRKIDMSNNFWDGNGILFPAFCRY